MLAHFKDHIAGQEGCIHYLEDANWNAVVKVRIQAHRKMTSDQQDSVRNNYLEGTAARVYRCRGALTPYLIQELRLALDVDKELSPEYQLAVDNIEEVRKWLSPE